MARYLDQVKGAAFAQPFDGLTDAQYRDRLMRAYAKEKPRRRLL